MKPYDRNIPYNNLPPLPPSYEFWKDPEIVKKLTASSRKLAELKGLASMLPNQSIFVNTISLREVKASSAIENIFTTDDELYRALTFHMRILFRDRQKKSCIIGRLCGKDLTNSNLTGE